jgi:predicted RNA-binding protein with RPS1 domain
VHPVREGEGPEAPLAAGARLKGRVQRIERFGVFVWLRPGVVGLMLSTASGTRMGTDLAGAFPIGKELEVDVVEIEGDGKRIRLAVPGAAAKPEAPARPAPRPPQRERRPAEPEAAPATPAPAFGNSLADALREAIKKSS